MFIILRLICEILSGIAVEISFLWDSKHGVYGAASFILIEMVTHDIYKRTWENLLQSFCIWTSYVSLSDQLGPRWKSIHNVWMENPSKEK